MGPSFQKHDDEGASLLYKNKFCFFQDHGSEPSSPNSAPENALEAAVKARREKDKGGMFKAEKTSDTFLF